MKTFPDTGGPSRTGGKLGAKPYPGTKPLSPLVFLVPKISPEALQEVRQALRAYEDAVEATNLASASKTIYIDRADRFVRWLDDDFEPGSGVD